MIQKKDDSSLFYLCSLIEFIGRHTKNRRIDVVDAFGKEGLKNVYDYADVFHCEPIEAVADKFIEKYWVKQGTFDNVASCRYKVPSFWDIGKVYMRLIVDLQPDNVIDTLIEVYGSWLAPKIDDYNIAVYYMAPEYLLASYTSCMLLK